MASESPASGPMDGTLRCLWRLSAIRRLFVRSGRLPASTGVLLSAIVSVLASITLGCSSPKKAPPTTLPTTVNRSVPTATAAATATAQASPTSALSGTWSGQYSGAFQGTFTLTWQQSGSNLSGTIMLSTSAAALNITGTVEGSAIRFGTVGSTAITYSGSVSGNSMSGTYQTQAGNGSTAGGPWSATKAS